MALTKIYGVLGQPIEHSLSPAMQNAAFVSLGLEARYCAFNVGRSRLREAIWGAEALGFGGLNLTIPLKEEALQVVRPDPTAEAMGAVNTIAFGDEIKGYNTDGIGAQMALEEAGVLIKDSCVLIIGAGGAAKAIAYQLARAGAEVTIVNRNADRACDLAGWVGGHGCALHELERRVPEADLVINATSVGMKEGDPSLVDGRLLKSSQTVFDVIYNRKTELLRDADRAGAKTVDGVMMLVYQGARAIEIWTGLKAPARVMERAVRKELEMR